MKPLTRGRLSLHIKPRDARMGVYVGRKAIYVCPLPFLVLRWDRQTVGPSRRPQPRPFTYVTHGSDRHD